MKNDIVKWIDIVILIVASALAIAAAIVYTVIYAKKLKEVRESGILDTLDRYGRPLPVVEDREANDVDEQTQSQTVEQKNAEEMSENSDGE